MSKNKQIILRVQSSEGTKRIEILPSATIRELYDSIRDAFDMDSYNFAVYGERNYKNELASSRSQTLDDYKLKHGDMVYIKTIEAGTSSVVEAFGPQPSTSSSSSSISSFASSFKPSKSTPPSKTEVQEDEVDTILAKTDGRLQRKRDPKLCRHNSNGCCVHCSPLEPWDEEFLKEQKIKHLSFHSYIRKLTSGVDRGKFVALEDLVCSIKSGCRDHPPWPKGICSKCQPSAITLNRQIYRHVDNVMFENTALVERFLNYWRTTGHQRMGFLYGSYEVNNDVPLGIRARVAAIYEPPQDSTRNSIKLLPDERAEEIDELATKLGLRKVGWIFTDLISDNAALGTVKHIRGIETHFLTAQECIMAGQLQNQHPNVCKYSSNGSFGSKFVTVCVTGDSSKQVHMEGYAVSGQCMALVRDNCLVPTKDAPELGYIRESSDKQYVPDVYYKVKDQYGNEVSRMARPLPVEYLLVDVPASTPLTPIYTFTARDTKDMFPVENRYIDGQLQDFNALSAYISKWEPNEFLEAISDFHLLLYLYFMDMLPMKSAMGPLLEAVRNKNYAAAVQWKEQEVWSTLETLITASSSASGGMEHYPDTNSVPTAADWTCNHCTFINRGELSSCEICNLPRN
ncbi:nuclear protein localization protein 4 homolog isoform X3 [Contarinia nasturtii]|uniref:nuclear protein localization protein 4 homolog isoform X3 n=2 Tax=Contarinia nasturtii TaxID=265458 RepID=UPI0012D3E8B3|nr:nuclear protein localization protein 4 homolog isoform X3 [Contarinia nasturtii]